MTNKILLIGAGGHAKSCIDAIESTGEFEIYGLIGHEEQVNSQVSGYSVCGTDDDLENFSEKVKYAVVTVGQIKSALLRKKLFLKLKDLKFSIPVIKSATAYVSRNAVIGNGTVILHGAIINSGAIVGSNCIINSSSVIEHDACIGDNCHISTGVIVNGDVSIGDDVFIGSGAVIKNGLNVADGSVVGMGNFVMKDIF